MRNINVFFLSTLLIVGISSCAGSGGIHQRSSNQYYPQGFYVDNYYYDPLYYDFQPSGNRVIIIDNRTNTRVASPRLTQIREVQNTTIRRRSRIDRESRSNASSDTRGTRRREGNDVNNGGTNSDSSPQRSRTREQTTTPERRPQKRGSQENTAPSTRENRSRDQRTATEGRQKERSTEQRTDPAPRQQRSREEGGSRREVQN